MGSVLTMGWKKRKNSLVLHSSQSPWPCSPETVPLRKPESPPLFPASAHYSALSFAADFFFFPKSTLHSL